MQEETNEKTIALYIKTGKLTAQQLQKAMKALLAQMKKQHDKQKIPHGKQTLKQLMKQNAGVSNIEITKDNIKAFESTAKKYGIDFALKKDSTETPPRYLVFFKGRDADALTAAFKEFSAKKDMSSRGFTIEELSKHGIGYVATEGPFFGYLIIPYYYKEVTIRVMPFEIEEYDSVLLMETGAEYKFEEVITKTVEKFEVPRKRIRELYKECKK